MAVRGGIVGHLAALRKRIVDRLRWDYYKSKVEHMASGLRMVPQTFYFPNGEPEQVPEVYIIYRRCKTHNVLWQAGGLADQPNLLLMQFDECAMAESEFTTVHLPALAEQDEKKIGTAASATVGNWRSLLKEE